MKRFMFAAAVGLTVTTAASATPTIRFEGVSRAYVSYRDLNLRSDEGRSQLVRRIRHAADVVCVDRSDLMPFVDSHGQCTRAAIASGVSQMAEIAGR